MGNTLASGGDCCKILQEISIEMWWMVQISRSVSNFGIYYWCSGMELWDVAWEFLKAIQLESTQDSWHRYFHICNCTGEPRLAVPLLILINLALLISDAIVFGMQMLALYLQPKRENECRRWWKIYHKILGYLLISMIVANIFQGIDHKDHAEKWKWIYVGILSVLSFSALVLEILRFVMPRIHR